MLQRYALIRRVNCCALDCTGLYWFVLVGLKVLAPMVACLKARAFRAMSFSLATTPAATSLRKSSL